MKNSTFITGLIVPVITREVIMENEIVEILFLNLNNIFQVLFTLFPKCTVPSVHVLKRPTQAWHFFSDFACLILVCFNGIDNLRLF